MSPTALRGLSEGCFSWYYCLTTSTFPLFRGAVLGAPRAPSGVFFIVFLAAPWGFFPLFLSTNSPILSLNRWILSLYSCFFSCKCQDFFVSLWYNLKVTVMMSFNDFLGFDGVCSIPVVNGVINIVKRGGVVDSIPFASASPRDIVRLMVAWSFTSDFCTRVEFVCGSSLLAYLDDSSLWRVVWCVSLPES